jgi:hypothetical protein
VNLVGLVVVRGLEKPIASARKPIFAPLVANVLQLMDMLFVSNAVKHIIGRTGSVRKSLRDTRRWNVTILLVSFVGPLSN